MFLTLARQATIQIDQLGQFRVIRVEIRNGNAEDSSQPLRELVVDFVNPQFVSVDSRAGNEGIQPGCNPELLLRQPHSQSSLLEARTENRRFLAGHPVAR